MKKKLTISKEELEKLYSELSSLEIAKKLNCNDATIRNYLRFFNIPIIVRHVPNIEKEELEKLYNEYGSYDKVAKIIGCGHTSVEKLIKKYSIQHKARGKERQLTMDDFVFSNDNEESFYWAGFLLGDGHISNGKYQRINLQLATKDRGHVELFAKFLKTNATITTRTTRRDYKNIETYHKISGISIRSQQMVNDLKRFNVIPQKTLTCTLPEWIIDHPLCHHFLRGLSDADGSWGYYNSNFNELNKMLVFSLYGTQIELQQYLNILSKYIPNIKSTPPYTHGKNCWALRFSAKSDVQAIVNYLYKDATVYLKRKFKVALFGLYGPNRTSLNENAILSDGDSQT